MERIQINPIRITYKGEDGKEHIEEITEAFKGILVNKEKEINQGEKIMNGKAMQEQPFVTRINDLLAQVEKGIYEFGSEIYEINKKLLPVVPSPGATESKDMNKESEKRVSQGWFIQITIKLETLREHLCQIHRNEIQRLKGALGLSAPLNEIENELGSGTHFDGRKKLDG